jgi:hypothetical protein
MQINNLNMGRQAKMFPGARRSQALQEEDAFMQLHGGTGSRWIFLTVSTIASAGCLLPHLTRNGLVRIRAAWQLGRNAATFVTGSKPLA